jgi:hypothetical protein
MSDNIKNCPDFPFFGAHYPDASCINGKLYDLDDCDDDKNLYEPTEDWPCPFCRTEAFIKQYAEYSGIKYKDARAKVKKLKEDYQPIDNNQKQQI